MTNPIPFIPKPRASLAARAARGDPAAMRAIRRLLDQQADTYRTQAAALARNTRLPHPLRDEALRVLQQVITSLEAIDVQTYALQCAHLFSRRRDDA